MLAACLLALGLPLAGPQAGPALQGPAGPAATRAKVLPPELPEGFVQWETPPAHGLALSPNGALLAAVNLPASRVELFDVSAGNLQPLDSLAVGLDPVSVRFRNNDELWVVEHLSDSISIVDLTTRSVARVLRTADEPVDVVFAGTPIRAFVSCSLPGIVQVFDLVDLDAAPVEINILGREPRALTVTPDGSGVLVAIFESGNGTTVLAGGVAPDSKGLIPEAVDEPTGPQGGVNPPPSAGPGFEPPLDGALPDPPRVSLIVGRDAAGRWTDDTGADWTDYVSGPLAELSSRPEGWDLYDHDLAQIDANSLEVDYAKRAMNICADVAMQPGTGLAVLVGTNARNIERFEPNLRGRFVDVILARIDLATGELQRADLNPHLDGSGAALPPAERALSVGDPRSIRFNSDGSLGFIAGLGSNNILVIDSDAVRVDPNPIAVGAGPTSLAVSNDDFSLFVLERFEGAVARIDIAQRTVVERHRFLDPTPPIVRNGRRLLYDTQLTSGTGHLSCASCHVDARWDRLAWDLGDPAGELASQAHLNVGGGVELYAKTIDAFHPMKGPMVTQTLQDIIGHEPFHWRGDKLGLGGFRQAYVDLQGLEVAPDLAQLAQLKAFLSTIRFEPNPLRRFDNSFPVALDTGWVSVGLFTPAGTPLPVGDPAHGLELFKPGGLGGEEVSCMTCHTLPTGMGSDRVWNPGLERWTQVPPGPNGEAHLWITGRDPSASRGLKVAQLRSLREKDGFDLLSNRSESGFGLSHDGVVDGVVRFLSLSFNVESEQNLADLAAFLQCFNGSDLPLPELDTYLVAPLGQPSLDTHAAVGLRLPLAAAYPQGPAGLRSLDQLFAVVQDVELGLVVHGRVGSERRAFAYLNGGQFQSDRAGEKYTLAELLALFAPEVPGVLTVVPSASQARMGIDVDEDGALNGDERDAGSNPLDPMSTP